MAEPFIISPVECRDLDDVLEHLEFVAALALGMAKIDGDADQAELATIKGRIGILRFKRDPALALELQRTAARIMADRTPCNLTDDEQRAAAKRLMEERK